MYRNIFGVVFLLLLSLSISAQNSSKELVGTWKGWDKVIKIYEDDKGLQGIFVDENGVQNQKELVLIDLFYEKASWKGKSYSKKREKTTDIKLKLVAPNKLKVKLDIGFMWMPFTWERMK